MVDILGQRRFAYSISDHRDFYEIKEGLDHNGAYKGSLIRFHDYNTGHIYIPFQLEENICYGNPVYIDEAYYFLQVDFNMDLVNLYKYYPVKFLEKIQVFKIEDLNLYNLKIMGKDLHLISQDDKLEIYYPYRKTIGLAGNESVLFIEDDMVFISAWIEEGWDEENNIEGFDYCYYEKLIVKNLEGQIILEKRGDLFQNDDGDWWLS